jgi:hypothetical protein
MATLLLTKPQDAVRLSSMAPSALYLDMAMGLLSSDNAESRSTSEVHTGPCDGCRIRFERKRSIMRERSVVDRLKTPVPESVADQIMGVSGKPWGGGGRDE